MSYYWCLVYRIDKIIIKIQGDCILFYCTLFKSLCEIVQYLLKTVIIVTSFVWGQYRVFVIVIVMG